MIEVTDYEQLVADIKRATFISKLNYAAKELLTEEQLTKARYAEIDVYSEYDDEGGTRYRVDSLKFIEEDKKTEVFSTHFYGMVREQLLDLVKRLYVDYDDTDFDSMGVDDLQSWAGDGTSDVLYEIKVSQDTDISKKIDLTEVLYYRLYKEYL